MSRTYATSVRKSTLDFSPDPLAADIVAQQDADFRRECRRISDFGFLFLDGTSGDIVKAEQLADDFISLIFEGGAFSTWRYRILLAVIRAGL